MNKLSGLLVPTDMPECLHKLMRKYKSDSDAQLTSGHTGRVKQRPGVQNHTRAAAPGPAPFSLVCHIFPAIVKAAFLVRALAYHKILFPI